MYEHMITPTADDWKNKENWEEYQLMIESVHHVTSQMKEE